MKQIICIVLLYLSFGCHPNSRIHPIKKNIIETVYASGKILADSEYTVYALSAGVVTRKLVKEGDTVRKDQLLYVVRYDVPASKLDAARTGFEQARANVSENSRILGELKMAMDNARATFTNDSLLYARRTKLWQAGIGTRNDVDNAYTAYITALNLVKSAEEKYHSTLNDLTVSLANAKSQLTGAQNDLSNYFIRSQGDGRVYQTFKEPGEAVRLNDAVALLGKTQGRIIRLAVDQQDIDRVRTGQDVLLKTDITGNRIYHATVSRIYPMMNESDQTFRVDALFDSASTQPFTHSSVEANILIERKNNVLTIPRLALLAGDSLMVKENGKVRMVFVHTGIRTLDEVEVTGGLSESAEIIMPIQK